MQVSKHKYMTYISTDSRKMLYLSYNRIHLSQLLLIGSSVAAQFEILISSYIINGSKQILKKKYHKFDKLNRISLNCTEFKQHYRPLQCPRIVTAQYILTRFLPNSPFPNAYIRGCMKANSHFTSATCQAGTVQIFFL